MTALRVVIGIDPGLTGAVATLLDGEPGPMLDMPTRRVDGTNEVAARTLAVWLRELRAAHPGAFVMVCLEHVSAAPMAGRRQGTSSMFNFGDGFGQIKAVLDVLGLPVVRVRPVTWKSHFSLAGKGVDKDAGRKMAIRRFPQVADQLRRMKDSGRGDALLLALWLENTQFRGQECA